MSLNTNMLKLTGVVVFVLLTGGCGNQRGTAEPGRPTTLPAAMTLPLSNRQPLDANQTSIRCESMLQTTVGDTRSPNPGGNASEISARAAVGTDVLILNVTDDEVNFQTRASFDAGSPGTPFRVLSNSAKTLIAVSAQSEPAMVNTLFIDKEQALGTWTKSRTQPLFSDVPDVATLYLVCR